MNNIDKDIERCKELIKIEHANWIGLTNQDAISNVLSELEKEKTKSKDVLRKLRNRVKEVKKLQKNPNYKSIVTKQNKTLEERAETIKSLKSELETYKKMADLMARQIDNYDTQLVINRFRSKEDVLDWARNEVENDKQS